MSAKASPDISPQPPFARQPIQSVLAGLLGRAIRPSQTPHMHEREGLRLGLNYVYKRIDFDALGLSDVDFGTIVDQCELLGFAGLNITHPFKQSAVAHVARLSPEARSIGAINTIVFTEAGRVGHNTDCWGFAESVRQNLAKASKERVVLVGAGGAGRAVLQALVDLGARDIVVHDTDVTAARTACDTIVECHPEVRCVPTGDLAASVSVADGIINATPFGMSKYPGVSLPIDALTPSQWVSDIVYFPEETALIQAARAKGCRVLTGGGMAVYQAVRAFELFSGIKPDPRAMASARESLSK